MIRINASRPRRLSSTHGLGRWRTQTTAQKRPRYGRRGWKRLEESKKHSGCSSAFESSHEKIRVACRGMYNDYEGHVRRREGPGHHMCYSIGIPRGNKL